MTTKKCPKCNGEGPFNVDNQRADGLSYRCRDCQLQYIRAWKAKHKDKPREYARNNYARHIEEARKERRAYYSVNKESMNARIRKNYERNTEYRLAQIRAWKNLNAHKIRQMSTQRRALVAKARGVSTADQILQRISFFGGLCAYCCKPFEHLDHVIALTNGGTNWPANLRPACATCNLRKSSRTWRKVKLT